jgi:hypothetical protein
MTCRWRRCDTLCCGCGPAHPWGTLARAGGGPQGRLPPSGGEPQCRAPWGGLQAAVEGLDRPQPQGFRDVASCDAAAGAESTATHRLLAPGCVLASQVCEAHVRRVFVPAVVQSAPRQLTLRCRCGCFTPSCAPHQDRVTTNTRWPRWRTDRCVETGLLGAALLARRLVGERVGAGGLFPLGQPLVPPARHPLPPPAGPTGCASAPCSRCMALCGVGIRGSCAGRGGGQPLWPWPRVWVPLATPVPAWRAAPVATTAAHRAHLCCDSPVALAMCSQGSR